MRLSHRELVLGFCICGLFAPAASAQPDCLTTSFASNGQFAGNMFDVEAKRNLDLTRWQVNTTGTGMVTITIYWREGTYVGFERDREAWTLLGSATTQGQGCDYPTSVHVGDLPLSEGGVYGIYVHLESYRIEEQELRWVRGEPTVFENDDLKLTTGVGLGFPAFTGGVFENSMWSGTVCYEDPKPRIDLTGDCPGAVTFRWDRATPNTNAALIVARETGHFTIPATACTGTVLQLERNLRVVTFFRTGSEGRGELTGRASQDLCGQFAQMVVVDGIPCATSNVVQIPQ